MKIVDVLGARGFKDGECIITQVHCWGYLYLWTAFVLINSKFDLINVPFLLLSALAGGRGRLFLRRGIRGGEDHDKKQSKQSVQYYNL